MRAWLWMLAGLTVWAVHFFLLYAIASIVPGTSAARIAVAVVTLACAAVLGGLLWRVGAMSKRGDAFEQWRSGIARLALGLSMIAIVWQGLPAILA